MKKQVCIYTQAYNAEKTLDRAVKSVISQNFCGLSPLYFLVNNGSKDSTGKIIDEYAEEYSWIRPFHIKENDMGILKEIMATIPRGKDGDWYFQLDADDEYSSEFFEKAYGFAKDNNLDIVACGVDLVNDSTGQIINSREIENALVIERSDYANMFMTYRRFFIEQWGKLSKFNLVKDWYVSWYRYIEDNPNNPNNPNNPSRTDFHSVLERLALTERIGVLSERMYKYYQVSKSSSRSFNKESIIYLPEHASFIRDWLSQFGEISKLNEDYIAAIYLGWCENQLNLLDSANIPNNLKAEYITKLLSYDETKKMLSRENCEPQFKNLSNRNNFINHANDRIKAYSNNE